VSPRALHGIAPRRVAFYWSRTPPHRVPGEPIATHVVNVLHLLLPAGERWFVKVFKEGLPLVEDPALLAEVKGFMGQEATHSVQHTYVLDHLAAQRLGTADFTRYVDLLFERLLGERPPLGAPISRLAGSVRYSPAAHNRAVHKGLLPSWRELVPRQATFAPSRRPARPLAAPAESPSTSSTRASGRHAESTHRTPLLDGQTLPAAALGAAIPRYLGRSYLPSREGALSRAVAYLERSPAARAAS
jgi:predicted metal-dependent hydrolase